MVHLGRGAQLTMSGALAAMVAGAPGVLADDLPSGGNATADGIEVQNDGEYIYGDGVGGTAVQDWVTPSTTAVAAAYECRVDVTSGSFTSGTTGTWLACSTTRTWSKVGAGEVQFNLSFRQTNGPTLKVYNLVVTVT